MEIWTREKAWDWYGNIGPIRGCNYLPRTAVNSTEMWQDRTFDLETIDREMNVVIAIGNPPVIQAVKEKLEKNKNLVFPNLIHPNAVYDRDATSFGAGNIVCAGTIFTTDITVGSCNIFNLSCTIGHDVKMGDCIVLNPTVNVSGGVCIGHKTLIGTGAKVLQNLSICDDTTVGAGAVVVKNIEEPGTYVGIPARKLQK